MGRPPKAKRVEKISKDAPLPVNEPKKEQSNRFTCIRCGKEYTRLNGFFPEIHTESYRALGYLPWCNECVDAIFASYLKTYGDKKEAVCRMCMKFDIYWDETIFENVEKTTGRNSPARSYLNKVNLYKYIDYSFDNTSTFGEDTLKSIVSNGTDDQPEEIEPDTPEDVTDVDESEYDETYDESEDVEEEEEDDLSGIPDEVKQFWGPGYTSDLYNELESRLNFWKHQYPDGYKFDVGELALLRQICGLEIDSNHDRVAGKSSDKSANTLNTLIGSLNLKPVQKRDEADAEIEGTPLGVYIQMWEQKKPLPEIDDKYKDINNNIKNIYTWFYGAACKMVGLKNAYCRMFERAVEKFRVQRPDIDETDDDAAIDEYFSAYGGDD